MALRARTWQRTAKLTRELAALVFAEARKARECEGLTGVTVERIEDDRVGYNWNVSHAHNATRMCGQIIADVEAKLRKLYDLAC